MVEEGDGEPAMGRGVDVADRFEGRGSHRRCLLGGRGRGGGAGELAGDMEHPLEAERSSLDPSSMLE